MASTGVAVAVVEMGIGIQLAPVKRVIVHDTPERLSALELGEGDLLEAGSIERLETVEAEELAVEVELAVQAAE